VIVLRNFNLMKRIFIAVKVEPGSELLRMISTVKALLGAENIKWVDQANIHITLAFLGDTEEERIKNLNNMLKESCRGFHEFDFLLTGTGVFKNFRDPRVIWVGIKSQEKLSKLYDKIADGLNETGFSIEARQFRPHLTLGRVKSVKDTENLKKVLEKYRDTEFQKVFVKEVILFESILMKTGPLYNNLGKFQLS
jgi:RNA 2',3'-cyclic 3'-phosphodiesterase